MHDYDTVLKSLLTGSENSLFSHITGATQGRWLNVELPNVTQPRVDLLFETLESARRLIAMELQSNNDPWIPVRMAEYSLFVYRRYKIFPEQHVLYVGSQPMRMPSELVGPNHFCRYKIFDIRNLDAATLLNSPFPTDIVIAILARYSNSLDTIQQILSRIAKLEPAACSAAFAKLMILAGLRHLEDAVRNEAKHMPIIDDIMDHKVIGPAIRQGLEKGLQQGRQQGIQQGRKEGRQEGRQEGKQEEAMNILRRLITEKFGPLPPAITDHLAKMSVPDLEELSSRLLRAATLNDLFEN